jgi:hypothetical protein
MVGWRIDDRVKVTRTTKKMIRVQFIRTADDCKFRD